MPFQAFTGSTAMRKIVSAGILGLCAALPTTAAADKWTVSCGPATLLAQEKNKDPYEQLQVRKYVMKVDVAAKSCAVEAVDAAYAKGKAGAVALKDPGAKCTLNVTKQGRVFMDARANLKGDKVLSSPILTLNYEVQKAPPAAGTPASTGKYFVIGGFPVQKVKGAQIDKEAKATCSQAK
jgi:hypothetical protein